MNLQEEYYNYIKYGTKRIEMRLNDEKRKNIKIGDIIEFENGKESFKTKVIDILKYNTFEELIDNNDMSLLATKDMKKEDLLKVLEQFYSKEKQKEYGVLGIKIELI